MTPTAVPPGSKVPVSEKALIARVNRKLAHQGEKIIKASPRTRSENLSYGGFHHIDTARNILLGGFDLEDDARTLGVLAPFERLEDES